MMGKGLVALCCCDEEDKRKRQGSGYSQEVEYRLASSSTPHNEERAYKSFPVVIHSILDMSMRFRINGSTRDFGNVCSASRSAP